MYVVDSTLGHGGLFNWLIEVTGTVAIRRRFADGQVYVNRYSKADLDLLHAFVSAREWTSLASDVQKLHQGTEKEGLGQFLKETLGMSIASAQGASQLAAIFVKAGVWEDNGRKRGMAFRSNDADWQPGLESYCSELLQRQIGAIAANDEAESSEVGEQLYFNLDPVEEVK
jgi:hypothetical protein